ncbi:hypothetical protein WJX84_011868 [Apatococcus fuscideae]|uniref:THIF-type NAD/FAD binding fold domain-containing protein n=1 Tax=Apatococcus fuscideae TaxID=2026836 RepID=A0AAW1T6L4_9CHLO
MVELTEAEAAVYDRQLRVWGVETQKRLNAAKVLIIGCSGLAAEAAKNIVLAGLGSLTIMASSTCAEVGSNNFLIPADVESSQSAAVACAATLQEMNPLVKVVGLQQPQAALPPEATLAAFNIVVLVDASLGEIQRADEACRRCSTAFYAASAQGTCSFMFADLCNHFWTPQGNDKSQALTQHSSTFVSFQHAMQHPWRKLHPRKSHKLFPILRVCLELEHKLKRRLGPSDTAAAMQLAGELATQEGAGADLFSDALLEEFLCGSQGLAAVNAVLGGVLANEILKAVSHRGEPLNNFMYFCLLDGAGVVEHIGG